MRIRTLSLFSGGGGLDVGFAAAGFDIVCATDVDPYSCKTLELNQGKKRYYRKHPVLNVDITRLTAADVLKAANLKRNEVDLVIGGPPCQAFSVFGRRRGLNDPRGNLVWEYARLIKEFKPRVFLFENVVGLRTIHNGELLKALEKFLSFRGGYHVTIHDYKMANYGVPQFRQRVFLVGKRNGSGLPPLAITHGHSGVLFPNIRPYKTVKEALSNMPEPSAESALANHIGRDHSCLLYTSPSPRD